MVSVFITLENYFRQDRNSFICLYGFCTMLAYELFLENESTGQDPGKSIPIKKIFVTKDTSIKIDDKPLDTYGRLSVPNKLSDFLQTHFDMPIDTNKNLSLPRKIVAPNAAKPYVAIPGYVKISIKKDQMSGEITLGYKPNGYFAKLSIPDYEQEIQSTDISLKIDEQNYRIGDTSLYVAYCKNEILVDNKIPAKLFESICIEFFEYVKKKEPVFPKGKSSFMLYVLPGTEPIVFVRPNNTADPTQVDPSDESNNTAELLCIDPSDKSCSQYPIKPSQGVFFLSYDDPAFTINCKQEKEFYKNLGICKNMLDKIILPNTKKMSIAGFEWYFTSLENADLHFERKNVGIFGQLYSNYQKLCEKKTTENNPKLLIFCIKKTNAKLEVMISENLSLTRLDNMFSNINDSIPLSVLERTLIITRGKSTTYRYYIAAIKSILNQTSFDPVLLQKIFSEIIHDNIRKWLDSQRDAEDFFMRSEFCKKHLKTTIKNNQRMNQQDDHTAEQYTQFAKKIGIMARIYIDFRKDHKFENNSFKTILTKSKYDFKTLQDVVKQIGRSVHLLKLDPNDEKTLLENLSKHTPDIDTIDTKDDYSYYFYLGYFGRTN